MAILRSFLRDIFVCVQLLSRLTLPAAIANHDTPNFTTSAQAFPVAGLLLSLPSVCAIAILSFANAPIFVIAAVAVGVQLIVTGALHEDGLADCVDGFGGGRTIEDKLAIMKDSRIGAFGVAALVMALIFRVCLVAALLEYAFLAAIFAFSAAQMLSRAFQVAFWHSLPNARENGLAHTFGAPGIIATGFALAIGGTGALVLTPIAFQTSSIAIALFLATGSVVAFRALCKKQIGGHTGDTIGAIQIITEIAFLLGLTTFAA